MTTDKPGTPRLTVDQVRARVGMLLVNGCRIHGEETALPESWVVLDPAHKGGAVRYVWTEHMIGPGWEPSPKCPHAALRGRIEGLAKELGKIAEGLTAGASRVGGGYAAGHQDCLRGVASRLTALTPDPEPRVCRCGTPESDEAWEEGARGCPRCGRPWPECLTAPYPEPSTGGGS
jgi:hypothetical protein